MALENVDDQDHVHTEPNRLASHQEEQLRKGRLAEHCIHREKAASSASVSIEQSADRQFYLFTEAFNKGFPEESTQEGTALDSPSADEVVEADCAPAVALKADNREAVANNDKLGNVDPHRE